MEQIGGFGFRVYITASVTFPVGFLVTQFADDADPFDLPNLTIAEKAMGLNGDLLIWSKPGPIDINMNVIPGSDDDKNLAVLLEANRNGKGKTSARDVVRMVGIYPDNSQIILTPGAILSGPPGSSVASSARLKSKGYGFTFENKA